MAFILNGKAVRDSLMVSLKESFSKISSPISVVIIQVGSRSDSTAFIKQKKILGEALGLTIIHDHCEESITQEALLSKIKSYNTDKTVTGILLQIPLPAHLQQDVLLEAIDPKKDIDGLTPYNTKLLFDGRPGGIIPATARGIISLLEYYQIPIAGKHAVIVGRSSLVGKPAAAILLNHDATVTIAHNETQDLPELTKTADILVVAIGDPEFITHHYVREGQVVIDIGINAGEKGVVGDVDFKNVEPIVSAISPVPGGVGPMTVVSLFQNVLDAYYLQNQ
ncbi:MAG: bifunctional 5,10-methylenetetrahydrofolate dehydrogenase/5,10-methenyltetrahydrofolate cyclohydrolase [bacterium]|nr:bifunctional 5,10-methylenetetrahydrofolate dehydrogenase/5,10-methenyltetrahydrofolate cyclohydrolase [bacterium]